MTTVAIGSAKKSRYYLYRMILVFSMKYCYSFGKITSLCLSQIAVGTVFSYEPFFFGQIIYLFLLQIVVFAGGVDTSATETKGTVLIQSAEQVVSKN